jgi:hypothetical protein
MTQCQIPLDIFCLELCTLLRIYGRAGLASATSADKMETSVRRGLIDAVRYDHYKLKLLAYKCDHIINVNQRNHWARI